MYDNDTWTFWEKRQRELEAGSLRRGSLYDGYIGPVNGQTNVVPGIYDVSVKSPVGNSLPLLAL